LQPAPEFTVTPTADLVDAQPVHIDSTNLDAPPWPEDVP